MELAKRLGTGSWYPFQNKKKKNPDSNAWFPLFIL
jgi:hypothetical protein